NNLLVLNCTEAIYKDIKKVVDKMEEFAADSTRTFRVVKLKGVDPLLVQQAIDAIQGRRTSTTGRGTGSGFGPGTGSGFGPGTGSGFQPFGTGGIVPGMQRGGFGPGGGGMPGGGGGGGP